MADELTGKEASDFHDAIGRREEAADARRLEEAKAVATTRGKEPFDLERFEEIYGMSDWRKEREGTPETRRAMREYDYYVLFEEVMTLEEYARDVWEHRDLPSDYPFR